MPPQTCNGRLPGNVSILQIRERLGSGIERVRIAVLSSDGYFGGLYSARVLV